MSTARNPQVATPNLNVLDMTLRACAVASAAAEAAAAFVRPASDQSLLGEIRQREEELDAVDREINEAVTEAVGHSNGENARELLACLKLIIELERIGDLLLSFANRVRSCTARLEEQDRRDLVNMANILHHMLQDAAEAFERRDPKLSVQVLRADSELDRLRNLVFVRHIENPGCQAHSESFHVVFMAQMLERCGDHAKNMAEEVVHLATGRSMRHLLRTLDKPLENMFVEWMRRRNEVR